MPYFIIRLDTNYHFLFTVKLRHSCIGEEGTGFDEYCENRKIKRIRTNDSCSDAIMIRNMHIHETFAWDQQEFIEITEDLKAELFAEK